MQEHLSDCSPHYACLCVTLRKKKAGSSEGGSSEQKREAGYQMLTPYFCHRPPFCGEIHELQ